MPLANKFSRPSWDDHASLEGSKHQCLSNGAKITQPRARFESTPSEDGRPSILHQPAENKLA